MQLALTYACAALWLRRALCVTLCQHGLGTLPSCEGGTKAGVGAPHLDQGDVVDAHSYRQQRHPQQQRRVTDHHSNPAGQAAWTLWSAAGTVALADTLSSALLAMLAPARNL